GKRSERTMPGKGPATASPSAVECDVCAYETQAATIVATPARMTGATIARTLGGTELGVFTAPPRSPQTEGQGRIRTSRSCGELSLPSPSSPLTTPSSGGLEVAPAEVDRPEHDSQGGGQYRKAN